jgi:hypothetical protein
LRRAIRPMASISARSLRQIAGQQQFHGFPIRAAEDKAARAAPNLGPRRTARRFPGAQQVARGDGGRFLGREGDGIGQRPIWGGDDPDRACHAPLSGPAKRAAPAMNCSSPRLTRAGQAPLLDHD